MKPGAIHFGIWLCSWVVLSLCGFGALGTNPVTSTKLSWTKAGLGGTMER